MRITVGRGAAVATFATVQQAQALQTGQATLFELADINRRDIRRVNEGVAIALGMETPQLLSDAIFAIAGVVG